MTHAITFDNPKQSNMMVAPIKNDGLDGLKPSNLMGFPIKNDGLVSHRISDRAAEPRELLDLFSTSPKIPVKCVNHAPHICIPPLDGKRGKLMQACCNDWLCPRCGELRAKHEYGRIVEGARSLAADNPLYFVTLSCTGTISLENAEKTYLEATNRLLDTFRCHAKKTGQKWAYVQVTERQERGHPHSHLIMTCCPSDAFYPTEEYTRYLETIHAVNENIPPEMRFTASPLAELSLLDIESQWFRLAAVKAGLGVQCRISRVDLVEGVSRYVAKYLFKSSMTTHWPKRWKRVRYSHGWPKLPVPPTTHAFPVLSAQDWHQVKNLPGTIETFDQEVYRRALLWECPNVVCRVPNEYDNPE